MKKNVTATMTAGSIENEKTMKGTDWIITQIDTPMGGVILDIVNTARGWVVNIYGSEGVASFAPRNRIMQLPFADFLALHNYVNTELVKD